jgi:biopolymer transport protein ExbB
MQLWALFGKGGPIMWPLLFASVVTLALVLERIVFIVRERRSRRPARIAEVLLAVEQGRVTQAIAAGADSGDFVVRTLVHGLRHRDSGFANALLQAANQELRRFGQGLTVLDTVITLAPLLGLLGTVTGMIRAFSLLGGVELAAPTVITGGIAEALIATAAGLGIAILALIPFNHLNARVEDARHEIEDASTRLELLLQRHARGDGA